MKLRSGMTTLIAAGLLLIRAVPSPAQLQLPPVAVPPVSLPPVAQPSQPLVRGASQTLQPVVSSVRLRARQLLQRYPQDVERDPRGAPVVRAVILALSPDASALQQALDRGFQIQSEQVLQPLGERVVTLLVPRGLGTQAALRQLREADPTGSYDFDHLFVESAQDAGAQAPASLPVAALPAPIDIRVGLIDGGVDITHPVFATQVPVVSGCNGKPRASAHGTAVASLFVGRMAGFHGGAPGARLLAVDIYCDVAAPGGRVRDIVLALGELMAAQVRVINISVVGPHNVVLAAVVGKALNRSIVIVAAAGNDGPGAPPLYPAAYPGVIAVTGVDAHEKVLMEACGGEHLRFAAPGADMLAAAPGGSYASVRGTSYASPLVAGVIAARLAHRPDEAERVIQELAASAADRGRKGRDRRYGYGLVGMDLRVDPSRLVDGRVMDGSAGADRRTQ
jgi:subtilisin family serine protease